jgi:hypothetical protein
MWVTQNPPSLDIQPALLTGGTAIDTFPSAIYPATEVGPTGIEADGNGRYYFANLGDGYNGSLFVNPNVTVLTNSGGTVSPRATGYTGGSALMALNTTMDLAIDQSGNLWVVNQSNSNNSATSLAGGAYLGNGVGAGNLTEFVGLAAPVNPVLVEDAANQTYAQKP